MGYIITIESESKQALAFLDYARSLDFVRISKGKPIVYHKEQEAFKKRMRKNLQQVALHKKGKLKTDSLDDFLNSL